MESGLKQKLVALEVQDLTAGELYVFASENGLDITKIKITTADRKRVEQLIGEDPLHNIINTRVKEYRSLFKDTRGEGEQGTLRNVMRNLLRFFRENPQYTFDDLLSYTRQYVDSFYGQYKIMRQADYFLYKYDNGTWISPIEDFINLNNNKEEREIRVELK